MPTDPRDTGWTVLDDDADGYSDWVQFNGSHLQSIEFPAMEATVTEIWFEEANSGSATTGRPVYFDDGNGTTARLVITVPADITVETDTWTVQVDPGKFGGLDWVRIQLTDGAAGVQQSADRAIGIGCRDYR